MKSFSQWAEENQHDVKSVMSEPTVVSGQEVSEKTKRGGLKPGYPDGYVRNQYPDNYFTPISASAPVDLQNSKKKKS